MILTLTPDPCDIKADPLRDARFRNRSSFLSSPIPPFFCAYYSAAYTVLLTRAHLSIQIPSAPSFTVTTTTTPTGIASYFSLHRYAWISKLLPPLMNSCMHSSH